MYAGTATSRDLDAMEAAWFAWHQAPSWASARVAPAPAPLWPRPLERGVPVGQYTNVEWWLPAPRAEPARVPLVPDTRPLKLTTLGALVWADDPAAEFFVWHYKKCVHTSLTDRWWTLQCGRDAEALAAWVDVLSLLEMDLRSQRDLFLLAQAGIVGRTHANRILWSLLTGPAVDGTYEDISHLVTDAVYSARRTFDRPHRQRRANRSWSWSSYAWSRAEDRRWSPLSVPDPGYLLLGLGGEPLQPPMCWGIQRTYH